MPWLFLSVGIILGSWWAYEVLGWGGYWAWDPVENASFLPWLAATGYLHSTVMQQRRKIMKAWTLAQVVAAFLLTILGTFMTRSGVFNSVHSFTQSAIGPIFLVFLAVVSIGSVLLLVVRSPLLENEGRIEAIWSRDTAFFFNNLLFVMLTFTVLLGTLFPLITEAVRGVKISVGEPYFDAMAMPIGLLMIFLMGVGPVLPWGQPNGRVVLRELALPAFCGLATAAGAAYRLPASGAVPLWALRAVRLCRLRHHARAVAASPSPRAGHAADLLAQLFWRPFGPTPTHRRLRGAPVDHLNRRGHRRLAKLPANHRGGPAPRRGPAFGRPVADLSAHRRGAGAPASGPGFLHSGRPGRQNPGHHAAAAQLLPQQCGSPSARRTWSPWAAATSI